MHLRILEVILSQPNANWQDSLSLDTIAPTPQPRHRRALLMKCVSRRRWDSIAQIDKGHKSSCEHRRLHLEAIELCAGNFELEQPTTFLGRWTFCTINNHDQYLTYVTSCMTTLLFCPSSVGAGKLDAIQRWTMLSTRSFSIETSARELIGRWRGEVGVGCGEYLYLRYKIT